VLSPTNPSHGPEFDLTRINSHSLLLDDSYRRRSNNNSFDGGSNGNIPQDYQVAIRSTENLFEICGTPDGSRRNSSQMKSASSSQGSTSQLIETAFMSEAASGPYEKIQIAVSSSRVPGPRGIGNRGSSTLPADMGSSGSLKTRGTPPTSRTELRRHTSGLDDEEDYARLDRNVGRGPHPLAHRRGSRGTSVSSVTSSMQSQQFPLLNHQRRSHSRDSESPSLPAKSPLPPLPPINNASPSYSSEDPPPSYNDVMITTSRNSSAAALSPSAVSMISNGAYESIESQSAAVGELESGTQALPNENPWSRNSSDTSLNPPHHQLNSNAITPYSQVSNFEIDSRIMEETRRGSGSVTKIPRFSLTGSGGALPYTEAVAEGVKQDASVVAV
jgi:hypothetical protein